jgi:pSer/pThr/pTyr-binding forkhead associated (FHA) protein
LQEESLLQLSADDANATIMDASNARVLAAGVLQRLGGRTGTEVEPLPIPATLVTESGQIFALKRTRALIGRADAQIGYPPEMFDAELSALDEHRSVSRPHALIVYADGMFSIRDLYSRHGVQVNDRKLSSSGSQQIYDGDVIRIGEIVLQFRLTP